MEAIPPTTPPTIAPVGVPLLSPLSGSSVGCAPITVVICTYVVISSPFDVILDEDMVSIVERKARQPPRRLDQEG